MRGLAPRTLLISSKRHVPRGLLVPECDVREPAPSLATNAAPAFTTTRGEVRWLAGERGASANRSRLVDFAGIPRERRCEGEGAPRRRGAMSRLWCSGDRFLEARDDGGRVLRSMSSSEVSHEEIDTRITVRPSATDPLSQQVPSSWTRRITSAVKASGSRPGTANRTSTWLSTTSLTTSTLGLCGQSRCHSPSTGDVPIDEGGDPRPAQRAQRRIDGYRAGSARPLRHGVDLVAPFGCFQVVGTDSHCGVVRGWVRSEGETTVERHVQPLVSIGRPRVGQFGAGQGYSRWPALASAHSPMAPST